MTVRFAVLGVLASWRLATGSGEVWGQDWVAIPPRATVGDTVWVERIVGAPVGWRVRADRFDATARVEPLADPTVERAAGGWRVRYAVAAWTPGGHAVTLPPIWLLAPDGRADSLAGGVARFELASVLPDTATAPQPGLAPMREPRRSPFPLLGALGAAAALLVAGVAWRRRAPRTVAEPSPPRVAAEMPDARWLAAGEPRAVAARAAARLRASIARAVPAAHEALSIDECLLVVAQARPAAPVSALREALLALTEARFAAVHGADSGALAARAAALARELRS
jgi:hypothetical protein